MKKNERFADRRPWPTVYVNARLDCNSTQFWWLRYSLSLSLFLSLETSLDKISQTLFSFRAFLALSPTESFSMIHFFTSESLGRLPLSYLILNWSKICANAIIYFPRLFRYSSFDQRESKKDKAIRLKYRINILRLYNYSESRCSLWNILKSLSLLLLIEEIRRTSDNCN